MTSLTETARFIIPSLHNLQMSHFVEPFISLNIMMLAIIWLVESCFRNYKDYMCEMIVLVAAEHEQ